MRNMIEGAIGRRQLLLGGVAVAVLAACNDPKPAAAVVDPAAGVTATTLKEGEKPIAATKYGKVSGFVENGVLGFKGVRYGADTNTTRFAAPKPPEPWTDIKEATAYGASTPQTPTGSGGGLFASWAPQPTPPMSEDCLFLNVWTPALHDGKKRPVMVWLHGGGFSSGSGSSLAYDGVRLSKRGDVVVVTINHRLNVFGHLYLADYGPEFADSGNVGILDILQALNWVKDNAAEFGGDAGNVMIFGESGGGAKVTTVMQMDAAKGLFHRGAVQSGAWLLFEEPKKASEAAAKLVAKLGLTKETIGDIRKKTVEEIRAALPGTGAGAGPVIDGKNLTAHPFDPKGPAPAKDVPMLIGSNRTESTLLGGAGNPELFELTEAKLPAALAKAYPGLDVKKVLATYKKLHPQATPSDIYFLATTDGRFLRAHAAQAERKAAQGGAPVYMYLYNWATPVEGGKWRVPHSAEIGMVFDNVAKSESMSGPPGPEQQQIADILSETWIAFAKTGDPNNPKVPKWEPYEAAKRETMVLDLKPELVSDPHGEERRLFDGRTMTANG